MAEHSKTTGEADLGDLGALADALEAISAEQESAPPGGLSAALRLVAAERKAEETIAALAHLRKVRLAQKRAITNQIHGATKRLRAVLDNAYREADADRLAETLRGATERGTSAAIVRDMLQQPLRYGKLKGKAAAGVNSPARRKALTALGDGLVMAERDLARSLAREKELEKGQDAALAERATKALAAISRAFPGALDRRWKMTVSARLACATAWLGATEDGSRKPESADENEVLATIEEGLLPGCEQLALPAKRAAIRILEASIRMTDAIQKDDREAQAAALDQLIARAKDLYAEGEDGQIQLSYAGRQISRLTDAKKPGKPAKAVKALDAARAGLSMGAKVSTKATRKAP